MTKGVVEGGTVGDKIRPGHATVMGKLRHCAKVCSHRPSLAAWLHLGCRCEEGKKRRDSSRKERMERVDGWGEDEEGMGGGRGMKKGLQRKGGGGEHVRWREGEGKDERGRGEGAARAETEARAGATGSDLVILPSNPCSSPSTPFVHPTINPEL